MWDGVVHEFVPHHIWVRDREIFEILKKLAMFKQYHTFQLPGHTKLLSWPEIRAAAAECALNRQAWRDAVKNLLRCSLRSTVQAGRLVNGALCNDCDLAEEDLEVIASRKASCGHGAQPYAPGLYGPTLYRCGVTAPTALLSCGLCGLKLWPECGLMMRSHLAVACSPPCCARMKPPLELMLCSAPPLSLSQALPEWRCLTHAPPPLASLSVTGVPQVARDSAHRSLPAPPARAVQPLARVVPDVWLGADGHPADGALGDGRPGGRLEARRGGPARGRPPAGAAAAARGQPRGCCCQRRGRTRRGCAACATAPRAMGSSGVGAGCGGRGTDDLAALAVMCAKLRAVDRAAGQPRQQQAQRRRPAVGHAGGQRAFSGRDPNVPHGHRHYQRRA
eukprot:222402-Chlamydomonas_euryale.AAC.2